ncbi:hypothetical protein RQP46_002107 [Phenoliferia psychrophenolica]
MELEDRGGPPTGNETEHSWGSNISDVSQAAPLDFADAVVIYQCVADRRSAFDLLLWCVPYRTSEAI